MYALNYIGEFSLPNLPIANLIKNLAQVSPLYIYCIIIYHCSGVVHCYTTACYNNINYCLLQEKVSSIYNFHLFDDHTVFMTFRLLSLIQSIREYVSCDD